MPPVELTENTSDQSMLITPIPAAFVPPSVKAKIGIIYPPPEVRSNFLFYLIIKNLILDLIFKHRYRR
jgi:hypothetical protein